MDLPALDGLSFNYLSGFCCCCYLFFCLASYISSFFTQNNCSQEENDKGYPQMLADLRQKKKEKKTTFDCLPKSYIYYATLKCMYLRDFFLS